MDRVNRYGASFSFLIFDIDHFKKVNDTYGHNVGDIVLKVMSEKLTEIKRCPDIVARFGGEEFVVVMPETEMGGATVFAERLRQVIAGMDIPVNGRNLKITASVGVATYGPLSKIMSVDEVIDDADKALYEAKQTGRNKVVIADLQLSGEQTASSPRGKVRLTCVSGGFR
jgi:diguanylate cyclase (GGDEF)-like protein